ncbi:MAG: reductase, partial [Zymomonas sp.]
VLDRGVERLATLPGEPAAFEVLTNDELVVPAPLRLWDFAKEAPRGSTRAIRVKLPSGSSYETGDHLAVYARNRLEIVDAALDRLAVAGDTLVRLDGASSRLRHLPFGRTLTMRELLEAYVDLQEIVSRRVIEQLAGVTGCPPSRRELERLSGGAYQSEIADKRVTLLDLLRRDPAIEATRDQFIAMSPAIQPRFYSIASSPRVLPDAVDLLVGTTAAPAWSGLGQHEGLASTYMRDTAPGDRVLGFIRRPNPPFAPPADPAVPIILIGPGTGFAPFRGFLQDRAARRDAGDCVGETHLFYGCRHPDHDWFYRDEMEAWAAAGIVTLHMAFSAVAEHPWRFVQDALWAQQEQVWQAIEAGGTVYVCGDGRFMAPAVRDTLIRVHMQQVGTTHPHASDWLEAMIADGRYHQDVFGFGK